MNRFRWLLLALTSLAIFSLMRFSPVESVFGDNSLYLSTSQAILTRGTIRLNEFESDTAFQHLLAKGNWALQKENGKSYNMFPLGTSLSAIPFVGAANLMGYDMRKQEHVRATQKTISAILIACIFLIFWRIARNWLRWWESFLAALIGVAGSSIASTMGAGLWSHNFTVFWTSILLLLLIQLENSQRSGLKLQLGIGSILFFLFLHRPNTVFLILFTLLFLFIRHRKSFWGIAASAATLLLLFAVYARIEWGNWIPMYYQPGRLKGETVFFQAFYSNLISPSRGLLIFTPWILIGFLGVFVAKVRKHLLYWVAIGAFLGNLIIISRFPHWWGGWSYGPRLQTDVLPLLFLSTVLTLAHISFKSKIIRKTGLVMTGLVGAWTIFIHIPQGLYNEKTMLWNGPVDSYPNHVLYNWRYPQFLAGYYPDYLAESEAILKIQLDLWLDRVPEGSQFLYRLPMSNGRRLARYYNQRKPYGDYHFFVDLHDSVPGRPIYTHLMGKTFLEMEYPDHFEMELQDPVSFGEWFRIPRPESEGVVAITSKNLIPARLSPETWSVLRELGSQLDSVNRQWNWAAVIEKNRIIWEKDGPEPILEFVFMNDSAIVVSSDTGKYDFEPQLQRWENVLTSMDREGLNVSTGIEARFSGNRYNFSSWCHDNDRRTVVRVKRQGSPE